MYEVYKVPVDAYDDPPICGIKIGKFQKYYDACKYADIIMERELDPESAYFVIPVEGAIEGIYSVGYIAPIEVTA